MKKSIKTFKRFMKEQKDTYYTCDIFPDMTKDDVIICFNELLPLTLKMIKQSQVLITVEPVFDREEQ